MTFSIDDLIPKKIPTETSLGTLYVRHATVSDWAKFGDSGESTERGRSIVRQLAGRIADKHDTGSLAPEEFDALTDLDLRALASAAVSRNGWTAPPDSDPLQGLAEAFAAARKQQAEDHRKIIETARQSISGKYAFLKGSSALDTLQDQVARLAEVRNSFAPSPDVREVFRRTESPVTAELNRQRSEEVFARRLDTRLLRPEESRIGKATIEAAEHSRIAATKMEALAEIVGALHQTFITEVFPRWSEGIESGRKSTEEQLRKATGGLWLTGVGLLVSALVAVAVARWQMDDSHKGDGDSAERAKRTEQLLRDQLSAQQRLIDQQARYSEQLRATIEAKLSRIAPAASSPRPNVSPAGTAAGS